MKRTPAERRAPKVPARRREQALGGQEVKGRGGGGGGKDEVGELASSFGLVLKDLREKKPWFDRKITEGEKEEETRVSGMMSQLEDRPHFEKKASGRERRRQR